MVEIIRLSHASFKLKGKDCIVYIDPYELTDGETADLILVTHSHFDHFSPDDIDKINGPDTIIVCPSDCEHRLMGNIRVIRPYGKTEHKGVKVEAVPSYNLKKEFHPKANGWLGFVVEIDGKRIYHAGDTDLIPEMKELKDIDYALLPVGGKYTMDAEEAAKAAELIKPKVAVPMHYGSVIGSVFDAESFVKLCNCKTKII
jgi:L-ascorbate metabolism protein UlaG (beta-lactamase superfamily)